MKQLDDVLSAIQTGTKADAIEAVATTRQIFQLQARQIVKDALEMRAFVRGSGAELLARIEKNARALMGDVDVKSNESAVDMRVVYPDRGDG